MDKIKTQRLQTGTIAAAVLCQSVYEGLQHTTEVNARSYLWFGSCGALLCVVLLRGYLKKIQGIRSHQRMLAGICCLAAVLGAVGTSARAMKLLGEFFFGSAGWLLLFFIFVAAWPVKDRALNSTGWALRWLAALAGVLLLAGVWDQLEWERLSFQLELPRWYDWLLRLRPEYLALPLILEQPRRNAASLLPAMDFAVRGSFVILTELVFGQALAQRLRYGELLRSWSLGIFSRYDSFLLLVWLMLALFRVAVLVWIARCTAQLALGREPQWIGNE